MANTNVKPRDLTSEELTVLCEVRTFWGPQNSADDVVFSDSDEAILFVKARNGKRPVMVVLTNLGRWLADGALTKEQLREQVMGPLSAGRSRLYIKAIWMFSRMRAFLLGWTTSATLRRK
jgi:hypothetical protein